MHPGPIARIGVEKIEDGWFCSRLVLQEEEQRSMLAIGAFEKLQRLLRARRGEILRVDVACDDHERE